MGYWTCARLQPQREALALHCLGVNGYATYYPRLRVRRTRFGRKIELRPALFPGYCFVAIELQWHAARWTAGVLHLIMGGIAPARVPEAVIDEIRSRESNGLVELPKRPVAKPGDPVRITRGPLLGHVGLYAGMKPKERVEVLLALLGSQQRVTLPSGDIEAV